MSVQERGMGDKVEEEFSGTVFKGFEHEHSKIVSDGVNSHVELAHRPRRATKTPRYLMDYISR
ncbi:hypothetical protein PR048_011163 [Dryococelus australis]|uniref:Uncharacterized protein n=1 Tax=Dryococelus australis TaxID=614101 RepID=A0ABQ9HKV4_9NEOP|nr:hypothetical protein PR048_011163 [Dryococelus australis]